MQGGEKEKDRVHPMKNPRMIVASILALALVALAALGAITMSSSDTPQSSASSAAAGSLPAVSANAGEVPTVTAPTGTPPAELTTKDIIVGTGAEVLPTSTLTVHYYLMTWSLACYLSQRPKPGGSGTRRQSLGCWKIGRAHV